jgi:hypothetical protein
VPLVGREDVRAHLHPRHAVRLRCEIRRARSSRMTVRFP